MASPKAMFTSFVLCLFFLCTSCQLHKINVHTCAYDGEKMECDWQGEGHYVTDRRMPNVHLLNFIRFFDQGTITVAEADMPDLRLVTVTSGSTHALCQNIHVSAYVRVYVGVQECKMHGSTTKTTTPTTEARSGAKSSHADIDTSLSTQREQTNSPTSENSKTAVKVMLETTPGNYPHVSVSWESFVEVKILVVLLVVIACVSILCYVVIKVTKCMKQRKSKQKQDGSSIELFSVDTYKTSSFSQFANEQNNKKQS